jgi:hypothetical protein
MVAFPDRSEQESTAPQPPSLFDVLAQASREIAIRQLLEDAVRAGLFYASAVEANPQPEAAKIHWLRNEWLGKSRAAIALLDHS